MNVQMTKYIKDLKRINRYLLYSGLNDNGVCFITLLGKKN